MKADADWHLRVELPSRRHCTSITLGLTLPLQTARAPDRKGNSSVPGKKPAARVAVLPPLECAETPESTVCLFKEVTFAADELRLLAFRPGDGHPL